jgi:hypothetical protein
MWAAAQRHADVVRVLLAHRADVHARSDTWSQVEAVSPHGHLDYNRAIPYGSNTALMFAARVGDLASARLLVAAGANVNDEDAWGVSATVLAAHSGFPSWWSALEGITRPALASPGCTWRSQGRRTDGDAPGPRHRCQHAAQRGRRSAGSRRTGASSRSSLARRRLWLAARFTNRPGQPSARQARRRI